MLGLKSNHGLQLLKYIQLYQCCINAIYFFLYLFIYFFWGVGGWHGNFNISIYQLSLKILRVFFGKNEASLHSTSSAAFRTWGPFLKKKKHIRAIENVERRASKQVTSFKELSYEDRLRTIKLPTLAYRKYRGDMIEVFKVTHSIYDIAVSRGLLEMDQ